MTVTLQEYCDWRGAGVSVDRAEGVIRGVKILGLKSRNGRTYLPEALAQAVALYENAKVNVNHPKGHAALPRDYQDRIGTLRAVVCRNDGLFADFHFNPKHALAEQLAWDAQHAPENVGFSHNVLAKTSKHGEETVVEAITSVQSVDLVADPATTRGLFEAAGAKPLSEVTIDDLKRERPDLLEAIEGAATAEGQALKAEVDRLSLREAAGRKQATIRRLLAEFQLPLPETDDPGAKQIVSPRFLDALQAAPSDEAMRTLVEERAGLVRALKRGDSRPQARAAHAGEAPPDSKAFVAAIT